jgi:hypothetical protein
MEIRGRHYLRRSGDAQELLKDKLRLEALAATGAVSGVQQRPTTAFAGSEPDD